MISDILLIVTGGLVGFVLGYYSIHGDVFRKRIVASGELVITHKLSGDLLSGFDRLKEESGDGRVLVFFFDRAGSLHMRSSAEFTYVDRLFVLDTLKRTMNDFDEDDD